MFRPPCPRRIRLSKALAGRVNSISHIPKPGSTSVRALSGPASGLAKESSESSSRDTGFIKGIAVGTAGLSALLGLYVLLGPKSERESKSPSSGILASTTFSTDYASPEEVQLAIQELRETFPKKHVVTTEPDALQLYGSSENSYHPSSPHSVVVRVFETEDVVKVVNISRKYKVPITAHSGATSLEGHFAGFPSGSICLDMAGMDKIIQINESDGDMICQSGARWEQINDTLKEKGIPLFFPLDPGPGATIGGMIGTGCSGTNAVRYGTARAEWFLNVVSIICTALVIFIDAV